MKTILIIVLSATSTAWGATALEAYVDLRPSWSAAANELHTENEVGASAKLSETSALGYVQEFRTNLWNGGENFTLKDGYLRGQWDRIAREGNFSLGFEPRLILPTNPAERQAGLRTALRAIAKFAWQFTSAFTLEVWESPIFPWYGQDDDGARANRAFENRLELIPKFSLWGDRISVKTPLIFQAWRNRSFTGTAPWSYLLWVNPEILVTVAEKTSVGVSYYSETFVGTDQASLAEGLRSGVAQFVFQQSF